jgi:hypothetical protein
LSIRGSYLKLAKFWSLKATVAEYVYLFV